MRDLTLTDPCDRTDCMELSGNLSASSFPYLYARVVEVKGTHGPVAATMRLDRCSARALRDYLNAQLEAQ